MREREREEKRPDRREGRERDSGRERERERDRRRDGERSDDDGREGYQLKGAFQQPLHNSTDGLPAGWRRIVPDKAFREGIPIPPAGRSSAKYFYRHEERGVGQWERPRADGEKGKLDEANSERRKEEQGKDASQADERRKSPPTGPAATRGSATPTPPPNNRTSRKISLAAASACRALDELGFPVVAGRVGQRVSRISGLALTRLQQLQVRLPRLQALER